MGQLQSVVMAGRGLCLRSYGVQESMTGMKYSLTITDISYDQVHGAEDPKRFFH
ncbi:MAG: hypothetical protein QNJ46_29350 [Leptolyngbyaceae cyanobacterium MO_188.B28]|nr:hypothetical protein [Leptolyngbyaceae cyanobacterium MO_188.B28]